MSVFMLVELSVKDAELYAEYLRRVPAVIDQYNGSYIVRSSKVTPNSGGWKPDRIILVEFDSLGDLRKCFASPEYAGACASAERPTVTRSVVVQN